MNNWITDYMGLLVQCLVKCKDEAMVPAGLPESEVRRWQSSAELLVIGTPGFDDNSYAQMY